VLSIVDVIIELRYPSLLGYKLFPIS